MDCFPGVFHLKAIPFNFDNWYYILLHFWFLIALECHILVDTVPSFSFGGHGFYLHSKRLVHYWANVAVPPPFSNCLQKMILMISAKSLASKQTKTFLHNENRTINKKV